MSMQDLANLAAGVPGLPKRKIGRRLNGNVN
jgi:hypothetical protein